MEVTLGRGSHHTSESGRGDPECRISDLDVAARPVVLNESSSLAGGDGASFGWLNRRFIAEGGEDVHFNNYGGEERFWLGPEGGQFALWFADGEPFDVAHWKTPSGFNTGPFAPGAPWVTPTYPYSLATQ